MPMIRSEFDILRASYSRSKRMSARELLTALGNNCHRERESRQRVGNIFNMKSSYKCICCVLTIYSMLDILSCTTSFLDKLNVADSGGGGDGGGGGVSAKIQ